MKSALSIVMTLALSSLGCATQSTDTSLTAGHPAHADAKQAACCMAKDKTASGSHDHGGAVTPAADPHAGHAGHSSPAAPAAPAAPSDPHAGHAAADAADKKPIPYPLTVCLVSDEDLNAMGKPYGFVHEGRQIMLCCKACEKQFKQDTAKYLKKFDDAVKAKQK